MTDPLSDENKSKVIASFSVPYLKDGRHIAYLPIPDDALVMIGLVAAHWGTFEVQLDKLIAAFLTALSRPETDWKTQGFKRRKEFFLSLVSDNLAATFPAAAESYRKIMAEAAGLFWRRNLIVHGQYRVHFPAAGPEPPKFWAEGIYKNRTVKITVDRSTLDELWHGIAHLTGDLMETVKTHGTASPWPWTLPDTQILRVYRETNHPWHPKRDMRLPQPQELSGAGSIPSGPTVPFPLPEKPT